jgi:hypothetical protein
MYYHTVCVFEFGPTPNGCECVNVCEKRVVRYASRGWCFLLWAGDTAGALSSEQINLARVQSEKQVWL